MVHRITKHIKLPQPFSKEIIKLGAAIFETCFTLSKRTLKNILTRKIEDCLYKFLYLFANSTTFQGEIMVL